jgi:hypothetical protein
MARIEQMQSEVADLNAEADELDAEADEILGGGAEKALPFDLEIEIDERIPRMPLSVTMMDAKLTVTETKSIGDFRANLRQAIRGLWNGAASSDDFVAAMVSTVSIGFRQAFVEGIAECGFKPEEMSEQERAALQSQINEQFQYIFSLATDIEENSRANGGKLGPLYSRAELWVNNYPRVKTQASIAELVQGLRVVFTDIARGIKMAHCRRVVRWNARATGVSALW